jgi:transcriptional regulator GlxA family with amidase domain
MNDPSSLVVLKTEALIRQRPEASFSTASLARSAGVSCRTLHRAFARGCGYGPMEAVRRARLSYVRCDLVQAGPGTRVTDVAMRWGFFHLGRFSALYLGRFGELPSATLKRSGSSREPRQRRRPLPDPAHPPTMTAVGIV